MTQELEPSISTARRAWYARPYVLVIVFVSSAAVLVTGTLVLLLPRSAEIVRIMQWRMVRADSFRMDAVVQYEGKRDVRVGEGVMRATAEKVTVETGGWVVRGSDASALEQRFLVTVGPNHEIATVGGAYRRTGADNYVSFDALPEKVGAVQVGGYAARWLKFDPARVRRNIDAPIFGRGVEMGDADRGALLEELRRTPFLRFDGKLTNETLGGVPTHHYAVTPEILFIKDFFIRTETLRIGRELTAKERITLDTFFANVEAETGELWIGQRDYYLYRARLRFRYDDGVRHGVFSLTADFGKFNEETDIVAPSEESEDVTAVLESLLPGIANHLPLAKEGAVKRGGAESDAGGLPIEGAVVVEGGDADKDGLSDALESFYRTNPNDPDTDKDGASDGEEVGRGDNPDGKGKLFDFGLSDR